ncbi:sensor histidine kinase [Sphingomicrobium lutaoense]|uniref:histidine kinase n=1 Tax=Sphingomicrobium lutaoense TaxID=515949 RepID=A0A839YZC0_9SPHN|nr:histidine kinase dimerization/phosphoacceptor domain -containing protein [Sphingomicrobium lutaoense]MBB3764336.1 two-component sensor histidine kinase [Sphingomicrobium lutaoense]
MTSRLAASAAALSTPVKLLLYLTIALAPIGALLTWSAVSEVRQTQRAILGQADGKMVSAARAVDALIARNALALRVAANGAFAANTSDPCTAAAKSLEITPALSQRFILTSADGRQLCNDSEIGEVRRGEDVPAGGIAVWLAEDGDGVVTRVGVPGGSATSLVPIDQLRDTVEAAAPGIDMMTLAGRNGSLTLIGDGAIISGEQRTGSSDIASGRLKAHMAVDVADLTVSDRLLIFLPVLMFAIALLLSWLLMDRLLIRPLRKLRRAVANYDPDEHRFDLPARLGPATEIRDLGDAFVHTVGRIEQSEQVTASALEGQRKLVREVHHRVKNNLQVVASLLNIHSRGAEGGEAQAAYAGIGRRVEALAVVHRNHFAEVEESRGIQMRPLVTELASSLRSSAPPGSASSAFDLELDAVSTTQDVAVAAAFLITEVVEYIINKNQPTPIEISLRKVTELTARLTIASEALVDDADDDTQRLQFDRIVAGLARQLRSPLDKRLGSYAVDLPIFPEN